MTLKEHKALLVPGTRLICKDHWVKDRIGLCALIVKSGATVQTWNLLGKEYRSEFPKASELVRCDADGFRVECEHHGRKMYWEWVIA